ncbi:34179_t:CDS:2 [Gigaspora margarita]|uniref:34179_t:CDS:1 n=1 Tax=Gigaspora margarita TaxID=4874 RepID=A0ABM8VX93_GIGMA|nr:34179_t:CDS:2 [Gigaspora margarita]
MTNGDIAATKAFMLRVAKKKFWNVATNIRDPFDEDPIEAFFQEKLLSTRQLAKISSRVDNKPKALVSSFSNSPGGQASISIGTKI